MDVLHYVWVGAPSENPVLWMTDYKYHRNMVVLQYACVDVPSAYSAHWMIYYKNHMYREILYYVCIDVLSDRSVQWMICYKHHRYMNVLHYVCAAFSDRVSNYIHHRDLDNPQQVHGDVHSRCSGKDGKHRYRFNLKKGSERKCTHTQIHRCMYNIKWNPTLYIIFHFCCYGLIMLVIYACG